MYTCTYIYVCMSDDRGRCVVSFQIKFRGEHSICVSRLAGHVGFLMLLQEHFSVYLLCEALKII